MAVAVAQSNRMLDLEGIRISAASTGMTVSKTGGEGQDGANIGIAQTQDNGILIQTKDSAMKLTRNGIEMPDSGF